MFSRKLLVRDASVYTVFRARASQQLSCINFCIWEGHTCMHSSMYVARAADHSSLISLS